MKNIVNLFLCAALILSNATQETQSAICPSIVEKLIYYKCGNLKVFYGGPIDKQENGIRWIMPITFEDDNYKTRACYEVAFINCTPHTAQDAELLFVDISEINIKFKNSLTPDYKIFSSLLNGEYKNGKYVVIRFAEIANVYYPDIFINSLYGTKLDSDKDKIATYLHDFFQTQQQFSNYYENPIAETVYSESDNQILYQPILIKTKIDGELFSFYVVKIIKKNDTWMAYYLIYQANTTLEFLSELNEHVLVRIDSGCVSGQIYNDDACDCLDQLHDGLRQLQHNAENPGVIIHIPAHDGRGFGTAPKAETEIYKRGGRGRIHATDSLDTITAAQLLYGSDNYDLRSFKGVAEILVFLNITKIILLTDNVAKVASMQEHGINVIRKKTDTNKSSCLHHITAKKNSSHYFTE